MASSTDTRKSLAELYRKAARRVERKNQLSCCAITVLYSDKLAPVSCEPAMRYATTFAASMCGFNGLGQKLMMEIPENERQGFRVLALCFMAAMTERP